MPNRVALKILSFTLLIFSQLGFAAPKPTIPDVGFTKERPTHEAFAKKFVIATQGQASSLAGKEMFALGGNAIDAAAAISFAIAVERPQSTGIAGGGFMLIRFADKAEMIAVDFREMAPQTASAKMFLDDKGNVIEGKSTEGIFSVGVPGMVAGILEIQQKYGKLSRKQILAPAIRLAMSGFPIYPHLAQAISKQAEVLKKYPASAKIFLNARGEALKEGETLKQPDLAKTLRAISDKGHDGFYKGWVAEALVAEVTRLGGLIQQADLDGYQVKYRQPIVGEYRDFAIYSMPPPSSGGVHVIEILNVLENANMKESGPLDPINIHRTASAMQMAFADRAAYLGDSDFVNVPLVGLTSKKYAKKLWASIEPSKAQESTNVKAGNPLPYESDETTHFSVMDAKGNVIASTQTINGWLGSGVVVPTTGMVLNNEMDDFSAKAGTANLYGAIGGDNNAIVPGKRPLSSMSPTIVLKEGKPLLALGSPSGTRIITCVALGLLNYLEYGLPLFESIALPRYHHQWQPDEIRVDNPGFSPEISEKLTSLGYKINLNDLGCKVQAVAREGNRLHGVADPRGEGLAIGE